ncbi:MAG: hypothetical protein JWQ30_2393 [Sediminibacterium sp.]|nr:hypothetical protein [Sediminibacterium sp.]
MTGYELSEKMRKTRRRYPLTATEQALYYELVAICNEDQWPDVFSCSNDELCNAVHVSENTLNIARLSLIQAGLIFYKSGKSKRRYGNYSFSKELTTSKFEVNTSTNPSTNQGVNPGGNRGVNDADYIKTETKENSLLETFFSLEKSEEIIREFISAHRPPFIDPYLALWNLFAKKHKFTEATITKTRTRLFGERIKELQFNFLKVLDMAASSKFLLKSAWLSFDWIVKDDTNYVRVLEGGLSDSNKEDTEPEATGGFIKTGLDKTQREINFCYETFRGNKDLITITSLDIGMYNRLERDHLLSIIPAQRKDLRSKAIECNERAAEDQQLLHKIIKLLGILEYFQTQVDLKIELIYK